MEKKISFSNVTFAQLQQVAPITQEVNYDKFEEWFTTEYEFLEEEISFLEAHIKEHRSLLMTYSEEELKMKFISPILNRIKFSQGTIKDWYGRKISAVVNS